MLPAAVRRNADRAAQLSKEIRDAGIQPGSESPSPTASADIARLEGEVARLTTENSSTTQAYRVLQGKYNAEVPQMAAEIRTLREQVKQYEEAAKRKFEAGELTSLTDDERGLMGKPLQDAIVKTAREVFAGEFDGRIKPLTDRVDVLNRQSEAQFQATLDAIPNFAVQNDDAKFIAWLNNIDPETGRIRNDLLQRAVSAKQGLVCAEIFAAFRDGREIGASAPAKQPSPDPGPGGGDASHNLEAGGGAKTYTRAEISQFYDQKRRGKWAGKEAEARALEADMLAASASGRVTG